MASLYNTTKRKASFCFILNILCRFLHFSHGSVWKSGDKICVNKKWKFWLKWDIILYFRFSGRMALPMQFPHVYSKSFPTKTGCTGMVMTGASSSTPSGYGSTGSRRDNRLRIIKGDLVKPIPLSSLGMESDYELSDWEA